MAHGRDYAHKQRQQKEVTTQYRTRC
ncbi:hypothetical protein CCACVL1_07907 [Corchorus capsularis]|uniref:Uncharacterized protein n=1 Tax=Corchorus capsularis TaxID=210143 RepID=A0A1R3J3D9_COCAP|nr:hypothetical protein CCACVL1_07907 [Corchorus capsularis]